MKKDRSFRFSHAVSRKPGKSIAMGLRAASGPNPDPAAFQREHAAYVNFLEHTGAKVLVLPALEAFPDSVFVEDPVLCVASTAIILRPGAKSRFGEAAEMAENLKQIFTSIEILPEGFVDGGDILMTETEALIGLSERTNQQGVDALSPILARLGYQTRIVITPPGVLHFKSDCGLLDSETIFSTAALAASRCFEGYKVIIAPQGEEAAANLIRFNDYVIMRTGFPKTYAKLADAGYKIHQLSADEAAKVDGGLSCMSLRFSL